MGRGDLGLGLNRLEYGRMLLGVRSSCQQVLRVIGGKWPTKRYPIRSVMNTLLVPAIKDPRELATKIKETTYQSRQSRDVLFE